MLPDDKRTQLDGIVQKMVQNKESDSNIRFVVDDFKKKYTPTEQPIQSKPSMPLSSSNSGDFGTNLASSIKDVGTGVLKSAVRGTRDVASGLQALGQGTLAGGQNVLSGLTGGIVPKTSYRDVKNTTGLKSLSNESPVGQGVDEILRSKNRGEQVGTVLETAAEIGTGFIKSGAQQALKAGSVAKSSEKEAKYALDLVAPKASSEVSEQAIKQGRVSEPGLLKKAKMTPSTRDYQVADSVKGVVSPKRSVLQNVDAIDKDIRRINQGVKEYVSTNKVPFNTNQLKSKLNTGKEELKLIFASDTTAERTYNAVTDEFMKHVASKDTAGLLQARQEVDKIPAIKKLLDSRAIGENVKKEVVLTVRRMANEYIAELLPEGNAFRDSLLKESRMIEAIGNIAEKSKGMIGKNNLQILAQRYPVLKWVIGGIATGIAGGAGIGVGSAIIGSTD